MANFFTFFNVALTLTSTTLGLFRFYQSFKRAVTMGVRAEL